MKIYMLLEEDLESVQEGAMAHVKSCGSSRALIGCACDSHGRLVHHPDFNCTTLCMHSHTIAMSDRDTLEQEKVRT